MVESVHGTVRSLHQVDAERTDRQRISARLPFTPTDRSGNDGHASLEVTVLYLTGCPSWRTALERVRAASVEAGVEVCVTTRAVETIEDAVQVRFTGSPTVLVGGVDPFAGPARVPALVCRVYCTDDGFSGSPTIDQLVRALERGLIALAC